MNSTHWGLLDSGQLPRCPLWQVDLKLTHLNWSPEATLIHFQGLYLTLCELDYHILHGEIQQVQKLRAEVDIGELCLVEDLTSTRWYRGRVQNRKENQFDVFLIDHGNILSVGSAHISSCPDELLELPPKLVCGFLADVLLLRSCPRSVMEEYLLGLVGRNVTGYVQGLLPHKVLLLEVPDINRDLVRHGFGRHVDTDSFVLVVEMLTGKSLKRDAQPVPDVVVGKPTEPAFACDPSCWKSYKELLSRGGAKLSRGTRVRVRVTAAVKPGLFHCQMVSKERDLQEMSKKLAELFELENQERRARTPENLGLLCAVKGKEGRWRRGFLPFLPVNARVRVIFVDYGFFETVDVGNVRWLPPSFCSTPIMALPCSLSRRPEQLAVLRAGLLGDVVDMEVNGFDEMQHLYSVTLNQAEDGHKEPPQMEQRPAAAVKSVPPSRKLSRQTSCLNRENLLSRLLRTTVREDDDLRVNSVFVASVQHAHNPNDFWIRTQKRNEELEAMTSQMLAHFRQVKLDEDALPDPEPGTLCCAMFEEDMHFYRAVVTEVLEHGAEVLFIDYGNTEKVPSMLIKRMPAALASKAPFAINCTLARVFPCDIWTSGTCDFFRNAVFKKPLKVRVVSVGSSQVGVELTELDGAEGWNVAELLVSSKPEECFSRVPNAWKDPTKRRFRQPAGTPDGRRRSEQRGQDAEVQGSARFKASSVEPGVVDAGGLEGRAAPSVPETFVYSSFDLSPGCEELVYVTHISSQWELFCHLDRNTDVINSLQENISAQSKKPQQSADGGGAARKLCLAKYFDGNWYRASVRPTALPMYLNVFYVDFGDKQVTEESAVALIPDDCAELLRTPMQAVRCRLHSVPQTELHADTAEFLSRTAQHKPLRAAFRGENPDGSFDVELFDGDVSINDKVKEILQSHRGPTRTSVSPEQRHNGTKFRTSPKKQVPSSSRNNKQRASPAVSSTKPPRNLLVERQQHKVPKPSQEAESTRTRRLPPRSLPESFRTACFVSYVNSAGDFYLQLSEDESAILRLEEELNSASFRRLLRNAVAVRVGDPVVAVYRDDGALYRGVVKAFRGGSSCDVEFVDYGNTAAVEQPDVYSMPERLRSQARFSLPCALLDERAYEDDAAFSRAVTEKPLVVDFIGRRGTRWEVKLEVSDDEVGPPAPRGEDAPSRSAESKETVKVPEPTGRQKEPPVGTCALKVPLQTSGKAPGPRKKKNSAKKKNKAPFLQLLSSFADAFMTLNIQAEDQESGTVLSTGRSGRFYVRLQRTSYLLAVLESHIDAQMDKYQTEAPEELKEGLRCVVPVQTGGWKRAVVRRVAEESCRVFLVDHGAAQDVPRVYVRRQCSKLAKVADLAVLCRADELEAGEESCKLAIGQEVALLFVRQREAENLWLVQLNGRLRTSQAAGTPKVPAAEEPTVDTRPQEVVPAPIRTNESHFGFAAAVWTPSSFCVVLGDELPRKSPPEATHRCVLRGVTPAGVDGRWTEEAAAFFQQRLFQRKLQISFRELQADAQWKVDVVAGGVHVASELVAAGHARYVDVMLALRFQGPSADSEDECGREDEGADEAESFSDVHKRLHSRWNQCVTL